MNTVEAIQALNISDEDKHKLIHEMTYYNMLGVNLPLEMLVRIVIAAPIREKKGGEFSLSDAADISVRADKVLQSLYQK